MDKYDEKLRKKPFKDYNEFMQYIFDCVNITIDSHITKMKTVFASGQGGYKNVLYPDIEVASDVAKEKLMSFQSSEEEDSKEEKKAQEEEETEDDDFEIDEELLSLFASMTGNNEEEEKEESIEKTAAALTTEQRIEFIKERAALALKEGVSLPLFVLF